MLNLQEYKSRIDKVIELHLRGLNQKQISKDLSISIRDVNKIVIDYKEKMYGFSEKSPTVKAFEMFSDDKSPVDVVKALDIPPLVAEKLYSEYLRLEERHIVNLFFDEMRQKWPEFSNICQAVKKYYTNERIKIRFI